VRGKSIVTTIFDKLNLKDHEAGDKGWDALTGAGFDTVRLVAIDADWSALRFRRKEHIGRARPDGQGPERKKRWRASG